MESWKELIAEESKKEYYRKLKSYIDSEYQSGIVFPERKKIFAALELTPLHKVRVVILGQDPYHQPGQANGLAFSVKNGVKLPPSLVNIYKEIAREYNCGIPKSGNLESWARQGVLLLNTVLTVRKGEPNSHAGYGWEQFTDAVIDAVCQQPQPVVFMLWGKPAQTKGNRILKSMGTGELRGDRRLLMTSHPSPLSVHRGFNSCDHFKKCNSFLLERGEKEIQWFSEKTVPVLNNDQQKWQQHSMFASHQESDE